MNVSKECLNSEMTMAKNVVVKNIGSDVNFSIDDVLKSFVRKQSRIP